MIIRCFKSVFIAFVMMLCLLSSCQADPNGRIADPVTIKVAVVFEDPMTEECGGQYVHQWCRTPGYDFSWNNPREQLPAFIEAIRESSHGYVNYEVVEVYEADTTFTYFTHLPEVRHFSMTELEEYLRLPDWSPFDRGKIRYDYAGMVAHYGFDRKCDAGEIDEVWIYSTPISGCYESHLMGKDGFWLNSQPEEATCNELLTVMFFNYERDLACALESYGHRFESIMLEVYGWWDYDNKATKEELTTWEKYTGYAKKYEKYNPGNSHVGIVHFPPNGVRDYDFCNENSVMSYADNWFDYPEVKEEGGRLMNCKEWGGHEGYMRWWLSHMPHFEGISPYDGKLNNWWHYVVKYREAVAYEKELSE